MNGVKLSVSDGRICCRTLVWSEVGSRHQAWKG